MSGRRIRFVPLILILRREIVGLTRCSGYLSFGRQAVRSKLISSGVLENDAYVVIAGPANTYAHYVATLEEYSVQRYEGASTIFGQCMYCFGIIKSLLISFEK